MTARTVLITGFEPFDREPVNPSWEAVRALDGLRVGDHVVHARQTPCVFGAAIESLEQAMKALRPELVLCVGQAGGRSEMSIERVAINVDDARIADNAGRQPIDSPVVTGGPAAYFSTLPIKAIVRDLRHAGIPASVSNSAGTFVCNHIFYGLMHRLASIRMQAQAQAQAQAVETRGGFIHIPFLPEQATRFPGQPSMALQTMIDGLRIAIATALAVRTDIEETGGSLH